MDKHWSQDWLHWLACAPVEIQAQICIGLEKYMAEVEREREVLKLHEANAKWWERAAGILGHRAEKAEAALEQIVECRRNNPNELVEEVDDYLEEQEKPPESQVKLPQVVGRGGEANDEPLEVEGWEPATEFNEVTERIIKEASSKCGCGHDKPQCKHYGSISMFDGIFTCNSCGLSSNKATDFGEISIPTIEDVE